MTPPHKKLIPYLKCILRQLDENDIEGAARDARLALQLAEKAK